MLSCRWRVYIFYHLCSLPFFFVALSSPSSASSSNFLFRAGEGALKKVSESCTLGWRDVEDGTGSMVGVVSEVEGLWVVDTVEPKAVMVFSDEVVEVSTSVGKRGWFGAGLVLGGIVVPL